MYLLYSVVWAVFTVHLRSLLQGVFTDVNWGDNPPPFISNGFLIGILKAKLKKYISLKAVVYKLKILLYSKARVYFLGCTDDNWNISSYEPAFGEIAEKLWEKVIIYTCLCFWTTIILNTGSIKIYHRLKNRNFRAVVIY